MRLAIGGLPALLLLATPLAAAEGSWGVVDSDHALFEGTLASTAHVLAAYQPLPSPATRVSFYAESAEVWLCWTNSTQVGAITAGNFPGGPHVHTYPLHDLHGLIEEGSGEGFLGLGLGDALASLKADRLHVWPMFSGTLGNSPQAYGEDRPEVPAFAWKQPGLSLESNASGTLEARGDLTLKIMGPEVLLDARENRTLVSTAKTTRNAVMETQTWIDLRLHNATLRLEDAPNLAFLADDVRVAYRGSLDLVPGIAPAQGVWDVQARPTQDAGGDARLGFTVAEQKAAGWRELPLVDEPFAWPAWTVGALLAAGVAALVLVQARRRARAEVRVRLSAAECLEEARRARRARDPAGALLWARRAARARPRDGATLLEVAWLLDDAGRPAEARGVYERALRAARPADGGACLAFAVFLAIRFRDADRAEALAVEALRRDPGLVGALLAKEAALRVLSGRARFEKAVQEAERAGAAG